MNDHFSATLALLLKRQGLLFVSAGTDRLPDTYMQAFDINLAKLGYALSNRLRVALQTLSADKLTQIQAQIWQVLLSKVGGDQKHVPQFRRFPQDIPEDTHALWQQRVLSHYLQNPDQVCLFCQSSGTTHVLQACEHVVCDKCYDGSNYSACPICGQQVTEDSGFLKPAPTRQQPNEDIKFKVLDLGLDVDLAARTFFLSLCERKQAMSPVDKEDFLAVVRDHGLATLPWLPETIPVRENIALLFGSLLQQNEPAQVMAAASTYITTASDVLRLIAVYSGADPSLQGQSVYRQVDVSLLRGIKKYLPWLQSVQGHRYADLHKTLTVPHVIKRFKVARLSRPLRRAMLGFMESLRPDSLTEDMLRHRTYWVWLGEFLHPHEYKKLYPQVAAAFTIMRKKAGDGAAAPAFQTFYGKLETSLRQQDTRAMLALLRQRPGELARRLDLLLRTAETAETAAQAIGQAAGLDVSNALSEEVIATFAQALPQLATPVLLTLLAHLPVRLQRGDKRVYWPKGQVAKAVFAPDTRPALTAGPVNHILPLIENEMLQRFAQKPSFTYSIIDAGLKDILVPFNERTASKSAISLPRGSSVAINPKKTARLFLHWCQPEKNAQRTDLDLSVGFYSDDWQYKGVCSYYELQHRATDNSVIARSAGDITSAPYPDGASEFVDLDCEAATAQGIRYAVVVLNNYSGMAFEELERAFAGVMFRDDVEGQHFDPRTVELKFDLQGGNGIFLPMVMDLQDCRLHWLDMYSTGMFAFNNVANSNKAITTICPDMITYFASGTRLAMAHLAMLHAAARSQKVILRDDVSQIFERGVAESPRAFFRRLQQGAGEVYDMSQLPTGQAMLAALLEGDLALADGSSAYVLKAGAITGNLSASDMLS